MGIVLLQHAGQRPVLEFTGGQFQLHGEDRIVS